MMKISLVETVAVLGNSHSKMFNGDSMNLNGRVVTQQEADRGFKVAGNVRAPYVSLLASSRMQGEAVRACAIFNDYIKELASGSERSALKNYCLALKAVSLKGEVASICVLENRIALLRTGKTRVYRYRDGETVQLAQGGFEIVYNIKDNDIFFAVGPGCADNADEEQLSAAIGSNERPVKELLQNIYGALYDRVNPQDCSVSLARIKCEEVDDEKIFAEFEDNDVTEETAAKSDAEQQSEEPTAVQPAIASPENEISPDAENDTDTEGEGGSEKSGSKRSRIIIAVVIIVLVAALACAIAYVLLSGDEDIEESSTAEPESTTELYEELSEEVSEEASEEESSEEEETTTAAETTTTAAATTTRTTTTTTTAAATTATVAEESSETASDTEDTSASAEEEGTVADDDESDDSSEDNTADDDTTENSADDTTVSTDTEDLSE